MSKNLPDQPHSEEVDLGQLFKLIGNAFNRFFRFIGSIFNGLFLAFVWLVFFFKKHAIKILIAALIGFGLGYLKEKISAPVYQSTVIVKQNYETGKNLYNLIDFYNDLIDTGDEQTLMSVLDISQEDAASLVSIGVEPNITENQKLKDYDNFVRGLDSTLAASVDYDRYSENINLYEFKEQVLYVNVHNNINVNPIFNKIVENINKTQYFKREQEKDIKELENRESALKQALIKSDSLQNMYKRVLEKPLDDKKGTQTSITIEGSDQIDKTKEFELYKSEIEIRRELVQIERQKEDKSEILEIITRSQEKGVINNDIKILNQSFSPKVFYAGLFILILTLTLLGLQFLKYLEKFQDKL
ncbi:hypothetical protein ACS386_02635 [Flavobacteriaceae bacterium LMO-SS05]